MLAVPGLPLADLKELGVRRVSTDRSPTRAAIDAAVEVAAALRDGREVPAATSYARAQQRILDYARRADGAGR